MPFLWSRYYLLQEHTILARSHPSPLTLNSQKMKVSLPLAVLIGTIAWISTAFQQVSPIFGSCIGRRSCLVATPLFANSKNIKAAMEATENYGITSPEARLAWEVVEEFDARDNSAAFEAKEGQRI